MKFTLSHSQRSGDYIAFGLVEGDCEAPTWVAEKDAELFTPEEIGGVLADLANMGYESLVVEVADESKE